MTKERLPRAARPLLALVVVAICMGVAVGPFSALSTARAIPDAGFQREKLVEEVKKTNELLGQLVKLLRTETVNVRIQKASKEPPAPTER